jgi:hypothetical protein
LPPPSSPAFPHTRKASPWSSGEPRASRAPVETPKLRIQAQGKRQRIELRAVGDDEIERVRAQNARGASARQRVAASVS